MPERRVAILHAGPFTPLFGTFPEQLAQALNLQVVDHGAGLDLAYVLAWDMSVPLPCPSFIPIDALAMVQDKRQQARAFAAAGVSVPETYLCNDYAMVRELLADRPEQTWLLKWPTGCASLGHQILTSGFRPTPFWAAPFLVQAFVPQTSPQVHRLYAVAGQLFGWNVRRFPQGAPTSPWVTLASGAEYIPLGDAPDAAIAEAALALRATGLFDCFGAVDLLEGTDGRWYVLEVNSDGLDNFVLRDAKLGPIALEIDARLRAAIHGIAFTSAPKHQAR